MEGCEFLCGAQWFLHVLQGRSPGEHDLSQYEPVRGYVALVKGEGGFRDCLRALRCPVTPSSVSDPPVAVCSPIMELYYPVQ